jgi:hypothetical protein
VMCHMMMCARCMSKELHLRNLYIIKKVEENNEADDDVYTLHV